MAHLTGILNIDDVKSLPGKRIVFTDPPRSPDGKIEPSGILEGMAPLSPRPDILFGHQFSLIVDVKFAVSGITRSPPSSSISKAVPTNRQVHGVSVFFSGPGEKSRWVEPFGI